jgi:LysR family transcriptional regulator, glycine cleavage system transcriptional activator
MPKTHIRTRRTHPLNALRAFEAAARLGRVSAAADELGVTHGAVSRQVRQLEQYLDVELFEGSRRRPVVTLAGTRLADRLTALFERLDDTLIDVVDQRHGPLDVACYSTFAVRWLIPRLHRFQKANQNIDVRLTTSEDRIATGRVRHDMLIVALDPKSDLAEGDIQLFEEVLGPVVAPKLVSARRKTTLAGLADLTLLETRTRRNAWPIWAKAQSQVRPERPSRTAEFDHYSLAIEAAASGLGVCIVPLHLVADEVRSGRLVAPLGFSESGYRYVMRARTPTSDKVERFLTWIRAEILACQVHWHAIAAR